jgi:hypothetical protein
VFITLRPAGAHKRSRRSRGGSPWTRPLHRSRSRAAVTFTPTRVLRRDGKPADVFRVSDDSRRDRPDGFVVGDRLEAHPGRFEDRSLGEHRLQRVHLVRVFERVSHAYVREITEFSIDADVVVQEPVQLPPARSLGEAARAMSKHAPSRCFLPSPAQKHPHPGRCHFVPFTVPARRRTAARGRRTDAAPSLQGP